MKKILIVFGTRPEAIKMAPLIKEFKKYPDKFLVNVCVTAQHREMLDQVLDFFQIQPDYDFDLMKPSQDLYSLTADIIIAMKTVLEDFNPDFVFVQGDTSTTMVASLASFYNQSKVCHIEAGLRTHNKWSPYPEEINRQITSCIADYHFSPTETSKANLILENIPENKIVVTGNTAIDSLLQSVEILNDSHSKVIEEISKQLGNKNMILVTGHRRENHGDGFINICEALKQIAENNPDIQIIYPVHLNPNVQEPIYRILDGIVNINLINPLAYQDFIWMMNRSKLIITDSGGIQEEAPSLGKPVLLMRNTTERPEAVEAGTVILVGTETEKIIEETERLLKDPDWYNQMCTLHNPYGNGGACEQVVSFITKL